ncbi:MAG TPA: UTP--glucose-1-phosphate uridylyltransferase [Nocardioidaceae bacterium]|nr:UTP--glucose-1-phosphate uridylyltransferase [Nocardioidaceae bacterium]
MSEKGLQQAREKMTQAGVDPAAIEVFAHYYGLLERGETGMVPESSIQPIDVPALADIDLPDPPPTDALAGTAVVKLNGGLGTSMGLDRAKSLLQVRDGSSFLDVIVEQVLAARKKYDVRLPLLFMNSFRTSADTLAALERYPDLVSVPELPVEFLQNMEPKLRADDLTPVSWPADPDLEWCPPGHGDLYTALRGQGLLDRLLDAGFRRVFCSNSDNLGAVPDPLVAQWFADSGAPIAIEAVRRTASDKKGGHFARRTSDARVVLRETAQTPEDDRKALGDLDRHKFTSTNNLWFDVAAMREQMDRSDGVLGLAMIKNLKHVDPSDPSSPEVIQIETAMGAAIEVFEGAALIEVTRERFVPVKTTNDLLLIRSDAYELDGSWSLTLAEGLEQAPYVDLDPRHYKLVDDFEARFAAGVPSLREAGSLVVDGDWTFGADVRVVGPASLDDPGSPSRVDAGSTLG